jgi:putative NADH-flavin reductase
MKNEQKNTPMNLLVIGANGGIGRQVVEQALHNGHKVTAVVRNPDNLKLVHPSLNIVKGDIMQPETFEDYLKDQDAVISAIGVRGGVMADKPTTLYSEGSANILQAMQKAGIKRVFFISASAVEISPALPFFVRLVAKYILQKLLKQMYADLLRMESIVKENGTDWTIIRPPRLTDKPVTGRYRFAANKFLKNALSISRADVAHFIINHVHDETIDHAIVEIAY